MSLPKALIFLFIISIASAFGQGEFNNWYFGSNAAITFNSGSPQSFGGNQIDSYEGTASVSDCQGNLLFYTNGNVVYNKNNQLMSGGSGLSGSTGNTSPALIVKRPGGGGIYYIFTASDNSGLEYTTINMNGDGGQGQVIQRNTSLRFSATGKLAVTYHANGTDIWLVTHYDNSNRYESFLITATGISSSVTSNGSRTQGGIHGDMVISPDGSKVAFVEDVLGGFTSEGVTLADFNNATGKVSNEAFRAQNGDPHGCEFSSNSRFLYVNSTQVGMYQYDCSSANNGANLNNRRTLGGFSNIYGSLRRGPDNNIYFADVSSAFLGRINNSNSPAASLTSNAVSLGGASSGYGIVNTTLIGESEFVGPNAIIANNACFDTPVEFSLNFYTGVLEVIWNFDDPNSGFANSSFSNRPSHNFSAPGTYTVSANITYECGSETVNFVVFIEETPQTNFQDTIKACADVPVSIGENSQQGVDYIWSPSTHLNNNQIANPTFNHFGASEREFYEYIVTTASSVSNCSVMDTVIVELVTPILEPISDVSICAGDTVEIGNAAKIGYTYSWSPNNGLTSTTGSPVGIYNVSDNPNHFQRSYFLSVTYDGCTLVDDFNVDFRAQVQLVEPTTYESCALGYSHINSAGNPSWSYTWMPSKGDITDVNAYNPFYRIDYIGEGKDTSYMPVLLEDGSGCAGMDSVQMIVSNRAGIADYQYLCPGFGAQLKPFGDGIVFQWSPDYNIVTTSSEQPVVNPDKDTIYYLDVMDTYGCGYLDSVFVDVNPEVPVALGDDTTICSGDTLSMGVEYVVDSATYSWSPVDFLNRSDTGHVYTNSPDSITYMLTVSVDTCSGSDTINVNVSPLPNVEIIADTNICFGDSVLLLATGGQSYVWGPDQNALFNNDSATVFPNDTVNYVLTGTDSLGCSNSDTATVGVWPLPSIELARDTSICFGDSIQVNPQTNAIVFSWSPSDEVEDTTLLNPFFSPLSTSEYILRVIDQYNCANQDTLNLNVNHLPQINLTADTTICDGDSVYLWATGGVNYHWSPNNVTNQNERTTNGFVSENGAFYQVVVTTNQGCADSAEVEVSWNQNPVAAFSYENNFGCDGFTISYSDSSQNATSLRWLLGNGSSSNSSFPVTTYPFGFRGQTTLIASNDDVCYDSTSVKWNFSDLKDVIDIEAVNLITPNGDAFNECFEYDFNGEFEGCNNLQVFNRWGLKVYDSIDANECFRGMNIYNNQVLSVGTYFYVIDINGFIQNGFVEVMP